MINVLSRWWLFSQAAACFAVATGLIVLAGWAFDVPAFKGFYADITMKANAAVCFLFVDELYGLPRYTGIALHTAIALAMLSLGILAARHNAGVMAVVSAATPAGVMLRRLPLWVVALPILLGWIRVMALQRSYFDTAVGTAVLVVSLAARLQCRGAAHGSPPERAGTGKRSSCQEPRNIRRSE